MLHRFFIIALALSFLALPSGPANASSFKDVKCLFDAWNQLSPRMPYARTRPLNDMAPSERCDEYRKFARIAVYFKRHSSCTSFNFQRAWQLTGRCSRAELSCNGIDLGCVAEAIIGSRK